MQRSWAAQGEETRAMTQVAQQMLTSAPAAVVQPTQSARAWAKTPAFTSPCRGRLAPYLETPRRLRLLDCVTDSPPLASDMDRSIAVPPKYDARR